MQHTRDAVYRNARPAALLLWALLFAAALAFDHWVGADTARVNEHYRQEIPQ